MVFRDDEDEVLLFDSRAVKCCVGCRLGGEDDIEFMGQQILQQLRR